MWCYRQINLWHRPQIPAFCYSLGLVLEGLSLMVTCRDLVVVIRCRSRSRRLNRSDRRRICRMVQIRSRRFTE